MAQRELKSAAGTVLLLCSGCELASDLRAEGFAVTTASTVSEVRELLGQAEWPHVAVVDARAETPWRMDALDRMLELLTMAPIRIVRVGGVAAHDEAIVLPATASGSDITSAVRGLWSSTKAPASARGARATTAV